MSASTRLVLATLRGVAAALLIAAFVWLFYQPLIAATPDTAHPTGAQTWGHLLRSTHLSRQVAAGDLHPTLMTWWSGGTDPFGLTSPAVYYFLSLLSAAGGSVFVAGARLVPLAALFGGLSWLLFARRFGWTGATAAGLAWSVWPEHVRVALGEGDLPRVAATALLPLLFLSFLDALERWRWPWSGLAFVVLLHLTVSCDGPTALYVATAFAFLAAVLRLLSKSRGRAMLRGLALVVLGLLSAAWWLLPALPGYADAIRRPAESVLPLAASSAPNSNPVYYWGLCSLLLAVGLMISLRSRPVVARSLFLCAAVGFVLSTPEGTRLAAAVSLVPSWNPSLLATLAPLALFGGLLSLPERPSSGEATAIPVRRMVAAAATAALVVMSVGGESLFLAQPVSLGRPSPNLRAVSEHLLLGRTDGRVTVLDSGRLGSEPSYVLTLPGWREQTFGSFWTSSPMAEHLLNLNAAVQDQAYAYVVDRSLQMGSTHLLVLEEEVDEAAFAAHVREAGYTGPEPFERLLLFSHAASRTVSRSPYTVLAVGSLAGRASTLFPSVENGGARPLEAYDLEVLSEYRILLLAVSGKSGRSADESDDAPAGGAGSVSRRGLDLLRAYLQHGGTVITEEGGEVARLLGVGGGRREGGRVTTVRISEGHLVLTATGAIERALTAHQPGDVALLAGALNADPGEALPRERVEMTLYRTTGTSFHMEFQIPETWENDWIILPIAWTSRLRVTLDGSPVACRPVEGLVSLVAIPGRHTVTARSERDPRLLLGLVVSGWVNLLCLSFAVVQWGRARRFRHRSPADHPPSAPVS